MSDLKEKGGFIAYVFFKSGGSSQDQREQGWVM